MGKPVEIKPNIWWVGAVDFDMRNIHGQVTDSGTSYNAYLILDEHPTLIDTVKAPFADELLDNIRQLIDPAKIEYVVANHGEMDHSGSIAAVCQASPRATIVCTGKGEKILRGEFHEDISLPVRTVKTGDTINLGAHTLSFTEVPMVHWPDSMVTYCAEEKLLFSNDAFGQHYGTVERFDDEVPADTLERMVAIYYANIVEPFNRQVGAALKKLAPLDIQMIAPSHGVVWRTHVADIIARYEGFAADAHGNDAVIVYDSMWGSTEKMAQAIAAGFERAGMKVHVYDLKEGRFSDALTDVLDASFVCVGSPTRNNTMLPYASYFLTELAGLFGKNDRKGLAFGSYGWAPAGPKAIAKQLEEMGYEQPISPIMFNWVPTEADLEAMTNRIAQEFA